MTNPVENYEEAVASQKRQAEVREVRDTFVRKILNSLSDEYTEEFVHQMTTEHRTLQQNFTKLVVRWLQVLVDTERFDLRNEASIKLAKKLLEGKTEYDLALPLV